MSKKSSHCNIIYAWYEKFVQEDSPLERTKAQKNYVYNRHAVRAGLLAVATWFDLQAKNLNYLSES